MNYIVICSKCGKNIPGKKSKCPFCGETVTMSSKIAGSEFSSDYLEEETNSSSQNTDYNPFGKDVQNLTKESKKRRSTVDTGSAAWGFFGFCFPIVGIILYFIWQRDFPKKGKSALDGALIAIALYFIAGVFNACSTYGFAMLDF